MPFNMVQSLGLTEDIFQQSAYIAINMEMKEEVGKKHSAL